MERGYSPARMVFHQASSERVMHVSEKILPPSTIGYDNVQELDRGQKLKVIVCEKKEKNVASSSSGDVEGASVSAPGQAPKEKIETKSGVLMKEGNAVVVLKEKDGNSITISKALFAVFLFLARQWGMDPDAPYSEKLMAFSRQAAILSAINKKREAHLKLAAEKEKEKNLKRANLDNIVKSWGESDSKKFKNC